MNANNGKNNTPSDFLVEMPASNSQADLKTLSIEYPACIDYPSKPPVVFWFSPLTSIYNECMYVVK